MFHLGTRVSREGKGESLTRQQSTPRQPKWESGGSPRVRERSSSELDWSKTEQGMILPLFSFPRRPWGRLHGRDRYYLGAYSGIVCFGEKH